MFPASPQSGAGMEARPGVTQGAKVRLRCEASAAGQTTGNGSQVGGRTTSKDSSVTETAGSAGGFMGRLHSETGSCWHSSGSASLMSGKAREVWTGRPGFSDDRGVPHRDFGACPGL